VSRKLALVVAPVLGSVTLHFCAFDVGLKRVVVDGLEVESIGGGLHPHQGTLAILLRDS
jgi:hypothetical protein